MTAALQCEICGGKLIGHPGGVFECESCGMEYSTAWAKAKLQEIRGKIQVEGTVTVTGKVQVGGGPTAESLIKRGVLALEDGNSIDAKRIFTQLLDSEPENAEAYLGLAMINSNCRNRQELQNRYMEGNSKLPNDHNIIRARQFDKRLDNWFRSMDEERKKQATKLKIPRDKSAAIAKRVSMYPHIVGLKTNGMVLGEKGLLGWTDVIAVSGGPSALIADGTVLTKSGVNTTQWNNIVAIADGQFHLVGLKSDGTVIASMGFGAIDTYHCCDVGSWCDIIGIAAGFNFTVGLKKDGTVVAVGNNKNGQCNVSQWRNIVQIAACGNSEYGHTVGLMENGTVVDTLNDTSSLESIISIAASPTATFALKDDGTVYPINYYSFENEIIQSWKNVVAISAGDNGILAVKDDGTITGSGDKFHITSWEENYTAPQGWSKYPQDWRLFNSINTIDQECDNNKSRDQAVPTKEFVVGQINKYIDNKINKRETLFFDVNNEGWFSKHSTKLCSFRVVFDLHSDRSVVYVIDTNQEYYLLKEHPQKKGERWYRDGGGYKKEVSGMIYDIRRSSREEVISEIYGRLVKRGVTNSYYDLNYALDL